MSATGGERPDRALVIGAHPDDCEFGAGATVARWSADGCAVTLVVLTDGSRGSHDPVVSAAALRDTREAEQRAAADALGLAEVRFLRAVDGELEPVRELRRMLCAAIRELRPVVVLTHDPWARDDLHPDHAVAGRLAVDALYDAREPRSATELAARGLDPWRPEALLLWNVAEPDHREPAGEAAWQAKLDALLCHRSQYATSFDLDPGRPDVERFAARLRERALARSPDGTLAESFRRLALPGWPAPASPA